MLKQKHETPFAWRPGGRLWKLVLLRALLSSMRTWDWSDGEHTLLVLDWWDISRGWWRALGASNEAGWATSRH